MNERNAARGRFGILIAVLLSAAATACGGSPSPTCDDWEAPMTTAGDDWEARGATPDKAPGTTHCDPPAPAPPPKTLSQR